MREQNPNRIVKKADPLKRKKKGTLKMKKRLKRQELQHKEPSKLN